MAAIDYNVKCPKCSAGMVLRTAQKGPSTGKQFYGCSRFPRCKGTRNPESSPENLIASAPSYQLQIPEHERNPFVANRPGSSERLKEKKGTPLSELQKKELIRLRDRLLNVSSRNRSIRLNRLDKKSAFDLSLLNSIDPDLVNQLIEHLLSQDAEISMLPKKTAEIEKIWDDLSSRLVHLHRNISEIYKEKGLHDLYIGFPFLSGRATGSETSIQAPIFLIPVRLEKTFPKRGTPTWTLKPSADSKVLFNKTLFFALSKLCNLTVNQDIFEEEVPSELYGDEHFIEFTHKLLQNYGIVSQIDEHALDEEFDRVREYAESDSKEVSDKPGLKIYQYAVLGHFPQSNSSLQKDYEAFLSMTQEELDGVTCFLSEEYLEQDQDLEDSVPESHFDFSETIEVSESSTIDNRPEKENFFLLPSDSSQDRIVLSLSQPSTDGLVIWGPPGTGKSQTIVNLIADCIAKGKTVLLVSQKRAALDVVYERLASRNMNSLAALVHDTKDDRKDLYKKIAAICTQDPAANLHVIDPTSEIESVTTSLKEVTAAYNDNKFGKKSGRLFQELAAFDGVILESLDVKWLQVSFADLERLCQTLDSYQNLNRPELPLELRDSRKGFGKLDHDDRDSLVRVFKKTESPEIRYALEVLAIVNGHKISVDGRVAHIEALNRNVNEDRSFLKYLSLGFFSQWLQLRSEISTSAKLLKRLTAEAKGIASIFFVPALVQELDFENASDKSVALLRLISTKIQLHFDSLKAIDLYKEKLPKEVQDLESKLVGHAQSNMSWGKILRCSVYAMWTRDIEKRHPIVSSIRSGHIDQLRTRLRSLLDQKKDYCVELLQKRLRLAVGSDNGQQFTRSVAVEVEKKRYVPSIRKLNEKFMGNGNFKAMLPVWLVSPETVSDVFPLTKGLFDVVIFDEASQCTVENGLPAVFRGKQVVIAGDEKQLPPNRLFETTIEEESQEENFASTEPSLLTLAKKNLTYQSMMLEWHYRSKHQELVAFSNEVFYGGRMKIAPNVIPFVKGNKPAIEWHSVSGFWSERINREEAEKVLELIQNYLDQDNPPSIGVITFNINQKNYIFDLIDKHRQSNPEFAALLEENGKLPLDAQLFVKNIENVQGDERDVIIFTTAYAPAHPGGRVQQHFGLLNQPGGENRLNVAVTRAIRKIHVVSSINPESDINTSTSTHLGPKIFQKYLCYAKAVSDENFGRIEAILREVNPNLSVRLDSKQLVFDSPFEEDVYGELSRRGYEVHSQVGQSGFRIDLAIVNPNDSSRYILGIECDGAMYHSSVSVRERDVFRQRFLESRGWAISRIWSPSWRENRNREVQKIVTKIEEILGR